MKKKKYELHKISKEFSWKDRKKIEKGCTVDGYTDTDTFFIESFDSLQEAMEALSQEETNISELSGSAGRYYLVQEYCIIESPEKDNYEIHGFSEMKISVYNDDTDELIGVYSNWKDAEYASISRENTYIEY